MTTGGSAPRARWCEAPSACTHASPPSAAPTAIVSDCNDVTDFLRYDARTGAPKEQRKTDIAEVEVTLRLVDGNWLVSKTVVKQSCKP